MKNTRKLADGSYLFQVEILVHAPTNGAAMEQLLHDLNQGSFADYRIQSGIQLGHQIEKELSEAAEASQLLTDALDSRIRGYIQSNQLIRITINKGKGVKLSWPCRVVNFDPALELLTLYHVDEKKVYTVNLNEVDDFVDG
ncbi:hypothetical protein COLU111180_06455 [Cohnella lubricantis]|uniref:Uncharacterized protein n=1 Tax=Cohnella lubricantis TaxID=2163172 RepID=A0A841TDS0_9BACL|nr:hypothetical protein [Cohnella lubricantis]MBB6677478.1 hypothetical protein [Cohnella lubricantis]MBP2116636.1 hypothetical protein [Cohnella lubricantis]